MRTDEVQAQAQDAPPEGKKAQQRRESVGRLMDLARRELIAKGYEATTVEQIAAAAGLSKGAVYFYFKSKANLLLALIDDAERCTVEPAVTAVRETDGSARDKLVAFLHAQSLVGQQYADRMMLVILMSIEFHGRGGQVEERLKAVHDAMTTLLVDVVAAGQRAGTIAGGVPARELASVVMAVNQGCFLEWYRRRDELRGVDLVRALRTTVLHGVLAPDS
ncbi:MAG: TetR/AcrR family transcriptional regulator [Streptosporangiales bacterium]